MNYIITAVKLLCEILVVLELSLAMHTAY